MDTTEGDARLSAVASQTAPRTDETNARVRLGYLRGRVIPSAGQRPARRMWPRQRRSFLGEAQGSGSGLAGDTDSDARCRLLLFSCVVRERKNPLRGSVSLPMVRVLV